MSNINTEGLPVEMQARIADIIEKAKANAIQPAVQQAPVAPPAPVVRPPSLMDHIIALRQEVAELRQQVHASAQVTEAVGNAVGQMYQMFQAQTEPTTYSSGFETSQPSMNDDF
jgi:hypothetical protein